MGKPSPIRIASYEYAVRTHIRSRAWSVRRPSGCRPGHCRRVADFNSNLDHNWPRHTVYILTSSATPVAKLDFLISNLCRRWHQVGVVASFGLPTYLDVAAFRIDAAFCRLFTPIVEGIARRGSDAVPCIDCSTPRSSPNAANQAASMDRSARCTVLGTFEHLCLQRRLCS